MPTPRGLSAGSMSVARSLDPADKPWDVDISEKRFLMTIDIVINAQLSQTPNGVSVIPHIENHYHQLLECLGHVGDYPPVADLLRVYHGLEGRWLVASPIHWHATHNDAMILASGPELQLSSEESRAWLAAFAAFVSDDNIHLHYHDAHTWLLQCDDKPGIVAKPVHTMHHQSMMHELKTLDDTLFWQRFITENQMFFSAHPLNKNRPGLYPLNGLWIWGGGDMMQGVSRPLIFKGYDAGCLARVISSSAKEYENNVPYSKGTVLLFDALNDKEQQQLESQLKQHTVRWYWTNTAYVSTPKRLWSRLMEKLK